MKRGRLDKCLVVLLFISVMSGCTRTGVGGSGDEKKEPWYLKGQEYRRQLNYEAAIDAFHKALEVNPRSSAAHQELGILYEQHKADPASAIFHYKRFLALKKESPVAGKIKNRITLCQVDLVDEIKKTGTVETRRKELTGLQQQLTKVTHEKENLLHENQLLKQRLQDINPALANINPPPPPQSSSRSTNVATQSKPDQAVARRHKVKSGDTLTYIADIFHVKVDDIKAANPDLKPRSMRVGSTVNIPPQKP